MLVSITKVTCHTAIQMNTLPLIIYFSNQVFLYWASLFKGLKTIDFTTELRIKEIQEATFEKNFLQSNQS